MIRKRISCDVTEELHKKIKELCVRQNITINSLICCLLEKLLKEVEKDEKK